MKFFFNFCSRLVVIPNNYYLRYYLLSILIADGLYAKQAILNALSVEAGYPQHEKHFLSNYMILFLCLLERGVSELFSDTPIRDIFCLSI